MMRGFIGYPNRSAPIRIPAKPSAGGFRRLVVDAIFLIADIEPIRKSGMVLGDRSRTIRIQKFIFIQHFFEHAAQARPVEHREHPSSGDALFRVIMTGSSHFGPLTGIRPVDEPLFLTAQVLGGLAACFLFNRLPGARREHRANTVEA
jgi:hypothetical protein